jgi:cell division inhibitor SepF
MSAFQKLKAYFGMVPGDEIDDYDRRVQYQSEYGEEYVADSDEYGQYPERPNARRRASGSRGGYRASADDVDEYEPEAERHSRRGWANQTPVRGSLAVDPQREPVARVRPVQEPATYPHGTIVTLHPRSYKEALTIGERYREGTPVIMNLTEMDDADARRLVDFAAGLAFALRGAIDKVTNKVFLLSPPNLDPTAEDKRRIVEGGFFGRG